MSFNINKKLKSLTKEELYKIIIELTNYKKENKEWLINKYQIVDVPDKVLDIYKNKISNDILKGFTQKGWQNILNLTAAKKTLFEFKKISNETEQIIELNLFLLKFSLDLINKYGEVYNEPFYINYVKIFSEVISTLNENKELIAKYDGFLKEIVDTATEGWGLKDDLSECYSLLNKM